MVVRAAVAAEATAAAATGVTAAVPIVAAGTGGMIAGTTICFRARRETPRDSSAASSRKRILFAVIKSTTLLRVLWQVQGRKEWAPTLQGHDIDIQDRQIASSLALCEGGQYVLSPKRKAPSKCGKW